MPICTGTIPDGSGLVYVQVSDSVGIFRRPEMRTWHVTEFRLSLVNGWSETDLEQVDMKDKQTNNSSCQTFLEAVYGSSFEHGPLVQSCKLPSTSPSKPEMFCAIQIVISIIQLEQRISCVCFLRYHVQVISPPANAQHPNGSCMSSNPGVFSSEPPKHLGSQRKSKEYTRRKP